MKNIENRHAVAGGGHTHTPATASPLGQEDTVMGTHQKDKGASSSSRSTFFLCASFPFFPSCPPLFYIHRSTPLHLGRRPGLAHLQRGAAGAQAEDTQSAHARHLADKPHQASARSTSKRQGVTSSLL